MLLTLSGLIIQILEQGFGNNSLLIVTLNNTIFLSILVTSIYGMVQSARGVYPEIPTLSESVYSQLPW